MDGRSDMKEIVGLLYKKRPLDKRELSDIGEFLSNPRHMDELNSYLDEISDESSSGIKLKIEALWCEIENRRQPAGRSVRLASVIRRYAAVFLLPLVVYTSWLTYRHFFTPEEYFTLATNKGEQTSIILPDGSSVKLNVDTRITYGTFFGKKDRKLAINGEAFFEVAKDPVKPFVVQVQNMEVTALGTAFNVRGYDHDAVIQTSLFEGKVEVEVNHDNGQLERELLIPGQSLIFSKETELTDKKNFCEAIVGAWIEQQLLFENTPFDEVVKNTERWFNVDIVYPAREFQHDYLTLRLKKGEPLERLLVIIDEMIGINYKIENNKITINRKE